MYFTSWVAREIARTYAGRIVNVVVVVVDVVQSVD